MSSVLVRHSVSNVLLRHSVSNALQSKTMLPMRYGKHVTHVSCSSSVQIQAIHRHKCSSLRHKVKVAGGKMAPAEQAYHMGS